MYSYFLLFVFTIGLNTIKAMEHQHLNGVKNSLSITIATFKKPQELTAVDYQNFFSAANSGNVSEIEQFIQQGINVNAANGQGDTALILAASRGNKKIIQVLVKANADVDKANNVGWTAMHWVSFFGYKKILNLLIRKSKNVNNVDSNNITPLIVAPSIPDASGNCFEVVKVLVAHNAKIDHIANDNTTAVSRARLVGNDTIADYLEIEQEHQKGCICITRR